MINLLTNPNPTFVFWLMLLHCLIGLCAAIIADRKNRSFPLWLLIGIIGGTLSLILVLFSPVKEND